MDQKEKTDIRSLNLKELTVFMEQLGEKAFRAKQIYQWLHGKQAASFEEMTNIPKALIEKLKENSHLVSIKQEAVQISKIDGTRKYLFLLDDGNVIESVFMRYKHGNSVCISSQVGCRMGCRFCASTLDGLVRGLTPSEMLDQIYQIGRDTGERVSNVVVMGTGNPHVLDKLRVDYYGTPTPIQQVANVNVPEPRMIQIQPWEASMVKEIEKVIMTSDLGINPTNDGKTIRLLFPELTEERRKDLAKDVKKKGESAKVAIRNIRRDANDSFKKLAKEDVSEDEIKALEENAQKMTDKYIAAVDEAVEVKTKEILTV